MADLAGWLQAGLQSHRAGDLAGAERLYRQILAVDPQYEDALNLLGLNLLGAACLQAGRAAEAVEQFTRALARNRAFAEAHFNLGNAFRDLRQPADALLSYRRAIALKPALAEAHFNLGNALRDLGQLDPAAQAFRDAIRHRLSSAMPSTATLSKFDTKEADIFVGLKETETQHWRDMSSRCDSQGAIRRECTYWPRRIAPGRLLRTN